MFWFCVLEISREAQMLEQVDTTSMTKLQLAPMFYFLHYMHDTLFRGALEFHGGISEQRL